MNRLPSIRRWGVAALTGVTLFGGLSIVGAGVANAATATTVFATLGVGAAAPNIPGTTGTLNTATTPPTVVYGAAVPGAPISLAISGAIALGDTVTLTLACPSTGTAQFGTGTGTFTLSGAGTADFGTTAAIATPGTTGGCSTVTLTATAADSTNATTTVTLTPTYTTDGVAAQALVITGAYNTPGVSSSFTVPTDANVNAYVIASNVPAVTLGSASSYTTTAISPVVISDTPTTITPAIKNGDVISLVLQGSETWASANPVSAGLAQGTVTAAGSLPLSQTPTLNTVANSLGGVGQVLSFTVTTAPFTAAPTTSTTAFWTLSGASVFTNNAPAGAVNMNVVDTQTVTPAVPAVPAIPAGSPGGPTPGVPAVPAVLSSFDMFTGVQVASIAGNTTTIFGANGTPDGTVAQEFLNAYPYNTASGQYGNRNVVLATDTPSANGSDALAASYLEGTLNTGLLITPATSLGTDAQNAIRLAGVTTVYVVGGPLAISPTVIAQIQALPAYNPGGLTTTGSNVKVVGPIYGSDGTPEGTAAMIAQYFAKNFGAGSFPLAYTASGGAYNDTTGSATAVAPSGATALPTAIVIASSDWQDAMSIAPEAFARRFPVILTGTSTSTTLGADAQAALTALGVKQVIVIGGQLALQNTVEAQIAALNGGISVLRIAGIDATDTAAQIANFAWSTAGNNSGLGWTAAAGFNSILASHADYWSDALGAAALGGGGNPTQFGYEPILLTQSPLVIGTYTTKELAVAGSLGVNHLNVLGGPLAMPAATVTAMLAGL
ncbi:MAG: hypothetical protein HIU57_02570 [Acidobacteria bacterium]|nr:hypothetical protein [Acidobacteriota bacterium]